MTSTRGGELGRLAEKWREDRSPDPHSDAWTLGYLRAKKECADELLAACKPEACEHTWREDGLGSYICTCTKCGAKG